MKPYSSKSNLKQHFDRQPLCGKWIQEIKNNNSLANYINNYENQFRKTKSNTCNACEKSFSTIGNLNKHLKNSFICSKWNKYNSLKPLKIYYEESNFMKISDMEQKTELTIDADEVKISSNLYFVNNPDTDNYIKIPSKINLEEYVEIINSFDKNNKNYISGLHIDSIIVFCVFYLLYTRKNYLFGNLSCGEIWLEIENVLYKFSMIKFNVVDKIAHKYLKLLKIADIWDAIKQIPLHTA
jgi:hypothetical protein